MLKLCATLTPKHIQNKERNYEINNGNKEKEPF